MNILNKFNKIDPRVGEVLIHRRKLHRGIKRAAKWMNYEYKNKTPIIIGILKGCIPFIGSIIPMLKFDFEIDFMSASSFKGGTKRVEQLELSLDLKTDIKGRDVIILEDIIDTARTLSLVVKELKSRQPNSIKIVTLLDKKECRKENLHADFASFEIPNKFIVGFGLDYKEIMRNFDYIGCLSKEYLSEEEKKG